MSSITISLIVFAWVFGGALFGIFLHAVLPQHHLSSETKDIVKLGMGLVGTMAALVLGLLVASAKGSYDAQGTELTQISANVALLDRALALYGPETKETRANIPAFRRDDTPDSFMHRGVVHLRPRTAAAIMIVSTMRMPARYSAPHPHQRYGMKLAATAGTVQARAICEVFLMPIRIGRVSAPPDLSPSTSSASFTSSRDTIAKNVIAAIGKI